MITYMQIQKSQEEMNMFVESKELSVQKLNIVVVSHSLVFFFQKKK